MATPLTGRRISPDGELAAAFATAKGLAEYPQQLPYAPEEVPPGAVLWRVTREMPTVTSCIVVETCCN
jgi:hypothetical protein